MNPLPPERAADDLYAAYIAAFELLKSEDPGSKQAFAALVGRNADDSLASFHLGRLLSGQMGAEIVLPGA